MLFVVEGDLPESPRRTLIMPRVLKLSSPSPRQVAKRLSGHALRVHINLDPGKQLHLTWSACWAGATAYSVLAKKETRKKETQRRPLPWKERGP
jgi:hypothetical protein